MGFGDEGISWLRGKTREPGYHIPVHKVYTLKERIGKVMGSSYEADMRYLLWKYGVSYRIEAAFDIIKYVAFLDKPMAEILDELRVPREWEGTEFIEFVGPSPLFYGPPEKSPLVPVIRRVTPGMMKVSDAFAVQPMVDPIPMLPILRMTSLRTKPALLDSVLLKNLEDLTEKLRYE